MNLRRRTFTVILAVAAVTGTAVPAASAAPGDLDPTFAGGGELRINGATYDIESLAGGGFALATGGTRATVAVYDRDGRRDAAFAAGSDDHPRTRRDPHGHRARRRHRTASRRLDRSPRGRSLDRTDAWLTRLTSDGTIDTASAATGYVRVARAPARVDSVGCRLREPHPGGGHRAGPTREGRRRHPAPVSPRRDARPDVRRGRSRAGDDRSVDSSVGDHGHPVGRRRSGGRALRRVDSTSELHQFSRDGARSRDFGARVGSS